MTRKPPGKPFLFYRNPIVTERLPPGGISPGRLRTKEMPQPCPRLCLHAISLVGPLWPRAYGALRRCLDSSSCGRHLAASGGDDRRSVRLRLRRRRRRRLAVQLRAAAKCRPQLLLCVAAAGGGLRHAGCTRPRAAAYGRRRPPCAEEMMQPCPCYLHANSLVGQLLVVVRRRQSALCESPAWVQSFLSKHTYKYSKHT